MISYTDLFERLDAATINKYPPVDDTMPERLPQARLTIAFESSGLNQKII